MPEEEPEDTTVSTVADLHALFERVEGVDDPYSHLELRALVGEVQAKLARLLNVQSRSLGLGSASTRISEYLRLHVHEPVDVDRLAGVAGIQDFQRRIRELREAGWDIEHVPSLGERGGYLLKVSEPDPNRGAIWALAQQVRSEPGPPKRRILDLLARLRPSAAGSEELAYAAGGAGAAMIIEELVAEGLVEVVPDGQGGSLYRPAGGSQGEVRG